MNQVVLLQNWNQICQTIKDNNLCDWNQFSSVKDKLIPQAMSEGFLLLSIDTDFLAKWTNENFKQSIIQALNILFNKTFDVQIVSDENSSKNEVVQVEKHVTNEKIQPQNEKNNIKTTEQETLVPTLTFSSFVIGESNRLAYSMAVQVAENPGNKVLNPLFIYGKSGLGKTHLLRAIQNDIITTHPSLKVIYIDTNDLVNEYTQAATDHDRMKNSFVNFREKYEQADVLLIDDIQFLQGKKQTLDNVFQILNFLVTRGKQIVLSADRAPKVIDIDERYTSRFLQGGTCDIQPPELETKIAIIKSYVNEYNQQSTEDLLNIPDDIITFIAECSGSNIRELKGAITMIIYRYSFTGTSVDKDDLKKTLLNHFTSIKTNLTVEDIQKVVEDYYKVTHSELMGKSRSKHIAYARQIAFYLCRTILDVPYVELGNKFNKDHSTVLYAVNKIEQELLKNRSLEEEIELLKKIIKDL